MVGAKAALTKVRAIVRSLPDTVETATWGKPHFRVKDKIFCGFGDAEGEPSLGFKLEMDHQALVLEDPRFERAPYVGKHGWVTLDLSGSVDWREVAALVGESYRLIAPKASLAKLGGVPAAGGASGRKAPASAGARRPGAAKKTRSRRANGPKRS